MLTRLLPQPVEMDIDGKILKFAQLRIGEIARIQAWLDSLPSPLQTIRPHLEGLSLDERKQLLADAQKDSRSWPPQYGSTKAMELIGRPDGTKIFMRAALKRCQHSMTDLECDSITDNLDIDALSQIIEIASTGRLRTEDETEKK